MISNHRLPHSPIMTRDTYIAVSRRRVSTPPTPVTYTHTHTSFSVGLRSSPRTMSMTHLHPVTTLLPMRPKSLPRSLSPSLFLALSLSLVLTLSLSVSGPGKLDLSVSSHHRFTLLFQRNHHMVIRISLIGLACTRTHTHTHAHTHTHTHAHPQPFPPLGMCAMWVKGTYCNFYTGRSGLWILFRHIFLKANLGKPHH